MISYRFVPISSQKGVLFFETPGSTTMNATESKNQWQLRSLNIENEMKKTKKNLKFISN